MAASWVPLRWVAAVRRRVSDPVFWGGLTQTLKTVAAAVMAWLLALHFVGESQAFLAPWSALLTVHATVYRSVSRGARNVGATVLGVLIAYVFGDLLGLNALTLAVAVLLSLVVGRHHRLGSEGLTIATTALVVLTTGYSDDSASLEKRLLDTGIGIAVGVLVNLVVWPPLQDRYAARRVDTIDDELGALLSRIAADIRSGETRDRVAEWIERTNAIDQHLDDARATVRDASESTRLNFRRAGRRAGRRVDSGGPSMSDVLFRLEQAVAETRSMARSLQGHEDFTDEWRESFGQPWTNLLWDVGEAVSAADVEALHAMRWRIDDLCTVTAEQIGADQNWPVYGALLVNLLNITEALDLVASAQPVVSPRDRARDVQPSQTGTPPAAT